MLKLPKWIRAGRFARDEAGGLTAESVLWLPIFIVFLSMIIDASLVLHAEAKTMRIVQDVNRHASTGYYGSALEMEDVLAERVHAFSPKATVSSEIGSETVASTVKLPTNDLYVVGFLGIFMNLTVTVSSLHLMEI